MDHGASARWNEEKVGVDRSKPRGDFPSLAIVIKKLRACEIPEIPSGDDEHILKMRMDDDVNDGFASVQKIMSSTAHRRHREEWKERDRSCRDMRDL